jgi:hypothetical protein
MALLCTIGDGVRLGQGEYSGRKGFDREIGSDESSARNDHEENRTTEWTRRCAKDKRCLRGPIMPIYQSAQYGGLCEGTRTSSVMSGEKRSLGGREQGIKTEEGKPQSIEPPLGETGGNKPMDLYKGWRRGW